ncbi:type II secretion system protein GspM [Vibrio sagamiensis]|uniref:MSHA biogenesis protein MshJ n=1 Tax=Vibrio sagamiensis NBRC 104589 TaxID=1219064 RepID=A0A511QF65_9VIBR|nr:type II secretion system protein GspM [Vibrio sagamiensis]PNQ69855.1 MSHA biogenesis protein MshJ [Vibrio agarivorans]GEM75939.1 MSHA biogenesis protein MshJ [Vibrio sagamiensis NBRC 104589]
MIELLSSLEGRFDEITTREKVLILLCGQVIILMLIYSFVLEPKLSEVRNNQRLFEDIKLTNQKTESDILLIQAKLNKNPNTQLDHTIKELRMERTRLSALLEGVVERLISPSQMASVLEHVLAQQRGINLLSLKTLPTEPITEKGSAPKDSGYFIHPVRMEISGSYFSIVDYLTKLESLPVGYYWRSFHYKVQEYPKANLVLEVYTLSSREEFIGG